MFVPNREELAWAAGFFDGEGTAGYYEKRRGPGTTNALRLMIAQAGNWYVLARFRAAVGMHDRKIRKSRPADADRGWKTAYSFDITGHEHIQAAMAMLWPWLSPVKREQFHSAFRRYNSNGREKRRKDPDTCVRGHPYSGTNLYVNPSNGQRACKTCWREVYKPRYRSRVRSGQIPPSPSRQHPRVPALLPPHNCPECGKGISGAGGLMTHMKAAHGEPCMKAFRDKFPVFKRKRP